MRAARRTGFGNRFWSHEGPDVRAAQEHEDDEDPFASSTAATGRRGESAGSSGPTAMPHPGTRRDGGQETDDGSGVSIPLSETKGSGEGKGEVFYLGK